MEQQRGRLYGKIKKLKLCLTYLAASCYCYSYDLMTCKLKT